MKSKATIQEIHKALEKMTGASTVSIENRATIEDWYYRPAPDKTRAYITAMLPSDVQLALKANTLPAVKEDKLPTLGIRKDSRTYGIQEEKAFAKAELAKAYVTHMDQAGHGQ